MYQKGKVLSFFKIVRGDCESTFHINHTEKELSKVATMLVRMDDEIRIVMEQR